MNRDQYISALTFYFKAEAAGAIAGEVGMLLRQDPLEKYKLDIFRRLEASNKILLERALRQEGVARPAIEPSFYRNGIKLGQKFGEGAWELFLDRFEATVHPDAFTKYVIDDDGKEIVHEYEGVDLGLLRHLIRHELSLAKFVEQERQGLSHESAKSMEEVLNCKLCAGLVGAQDPVGW